MLVLNFFLIMFFFRLWGKTGLTVWVNISCIVSNIQVIKTVDFFGFEATLGNIIYATCFLATDILSEFYSEEDSKKAVNMGLFSQISMTLLMQCALFFIPSENDFADPALHTIFKIMPRIAAGSLAAYYISNRFDIFSYNLLKRKTKGKYMWLRNNLSTMLSQMLDTVVFTLSAFAGVYDRKILLEIMLTTYFLKLTVAFADTPVLYLARHWIQKGKIKDK